MLYKESAIAVMIAAMLVAATLFGGLALPALATHDSDAIEIASQTISQEDNESVIVDAVEMIAEKSTSRSSGTVTVELIQDDDVLRSATLTTSSISTLADTVEFDVANINVTGSFEILVEYFGSGQITVRNIDIVEGTQVAEDDGDDGSGDEGSGDEDTGGNEDEGSNGSADDLENIILTKTITPEEDELTVETVEFAAEKSTSRSSGTLTVAIVQDDEVLDTDQFNTREISTLMSDMEASFGGIEVTDDFQIVFMYDGSGQITIRDVEVPGATEPAQDGGSGEGPDTDSEITLTVEAVDQNGAKLAGLWVALLNGGGQMTKKGFTEHNATFILDPANSYMVEMGDYYNEDTQTSYEFQGWSDSANDNTRRSANPAEFQDNEETFTADYVVTGNAPPPVDDGDDEPTTTPPPTSPDGTVTAYAYRIPSEHWGPTFVSANADMYFVVYNSTGWIIYSGYFDENGHTINGLNDGETYWVSPTDCDECHGDPHDVVFDHWHDGSTERQRPVTNGDSVGAYYKYDPDP